MKMIHRPRVASISTSEKPVLLMNIGVGWSATTPFAYTLGIQQKYCHIGHLKENSYLRMLYEQDILNERDAIEHAITCLLYTSPSPRDKRQSRMPSSA